VCGGVPACKHYGCCGDVVFPTCVGVFLIFPEFLNLKISFPHVCGGVPDFLLLPYNPYQVFPTCVWVFHLMDVDSDSITGLDFTNHSRPMFTTYSRLMLTRRGRPMYTTHSRPVFTRHSRPMFTRHSRLILTRRGRPVFTTVAESLLRIISKENLIQGAHAREYHTRNDLPDKSW